MDDLSYCILEGNLTAAPESKGIERRDKTGFAQLCTFTIASNYSKRDGQGYREEVSYWDIECWNDLAQECFENLERGKFVRVTGSMRQERWKGDNDINRSRVMIRATDVQRGPKVKPA